MLVLQASLRSSQDAMEEVIVFVDALFAYSGSMISAHALSATLFVRNITSFFAPIASVINLLNAFHNSCPSLMIASSFYFCDFVTHRGVEIKANINALEIAFFKPLGAFLHYLQEGFVSVFGDRHYHPIHLCVFFTCLQMC